MVDRRHPFVRSSSTKPLATPINCHRFPPLRNDARRVQVGLRAQYPERDQDVARAGGGQEEIGRGDIEHVLRGALRSQVSEKAHFRTPIFPPEDLPEYIASISLHSHSPRSVMIERLRS